MTGIGQRPDWCESASIWIRWVRLRASSPGGATRSSTWKIRVCSQGIPSTSPSRAIIRQGVLPPLRASVNSPLAATAS